MDRNDCHVLRRTHGSVLYLTINNVAKANSMSEGMLRQLQLGLDSAHQDDSITGVVLTGNGEFFCTGMDFSVDGDSTADLSPELHNERYQRAERLYEAISTCPKTTIALVNGPCYGGGNGIVFACDIRIVVNATRFVLSEVKRGLSPALISRYLVREWGTSLAREAIITGRKVTPQELETLRIVHYVVQDIGEGRQRLDSVLESLEDCAPRAVAQSKRIVNAVYEEPSREGRQLIRDVFLDMTRPSEEAEYGIQQFRLGNREVDWASWYKSKNSPKL